jgi:hypothetical protein
MESHILTHPRPQSKNRFLRDTIVFAKTVGRAPLLGQTHSACRVIRVITMDHCFDKSVELLAGASPYFVTERL